MKLGGGLGSHVGESLVLDVADVMPETSLGFRHFLK